jgi:hypothetical protein
VPTRHDPLCGAFAGLSAHHHGRTGAVFFEALSQMNTLLALRSMRLASVMLVIPHIL